MSDGGGIEKLIGGCALVASMAAVFIAWDQGRVMRAQQHGEVYPVLQIDGFFARSDGQLEVGMNVSNNGVGPALVEAVELRVDERTVSDLRSLLQELPETASQSWSSLAGRAMAPGEQVETLSLRWRSDELTGAEEEGIRAFIQQATDWEIRICYCSVFRRCWETSRAGTARADRVERCPQHDTDIFTRFGES